MFIPAWAVILGAAATVYVLVVVPAEQERERSRVRRELGLLADVRETALSGWARDAIADAHTVATFPTARALLSPHPAYAPDPRFRDILDEFARIHQLRSITLLDRARRPRASTSAALRPSPGLRAFVARALAAGRDTLDVVRDADGRAALVVVSLTPAGDGCIVADLDPYRYLYVLLDPAPMGMASGEALLVHREPGGVRVISPGAGARLAPLTLLPAPDAPGAVGGLYATRAGFVRALDDRGEAALACVREVHGQGWTLVLKVDEDEALAPLHRELATRALITALLITALTALAFALVWGQRRAHGAALARHRERLAILLDEANDPVADLTPEGVFVQVNRRAEEFYGVPGGLVARNAFDSIVVPGAGPGFAEITRVLASHGRYTFPSEHLAAGGVRVPVEVSVRAVPIDGEAHWVAVVRDLRDRRRAEARIERLNRLLRATTAVVMAIHHEDDEQALFAKACRLSSGIGGFLLASVAMGHPDRAVEFAYMACRPPLEPGAIPITTNAATRNRGTSAMAIRTGRSVLIRDLDDERLDADVRESFERAGARSGGSSPIRVHGEVRGAFTLFSEDADAFDEEAMGLIESTAAELGHALGAIEDRRTRARVEERLGAMFAAGPAGFVVADDRGVVTHANAEFLRIVGRTREELDAGRIPAGALGAANGGGSDPAEPAPFETELERPDGARVPVLMGRMRLSRGAGETLAVVLDMTRLHETAASLRQTQMQLLQAQKMETIGQLAGGVAHDFNNLLTVIHGYAELLRSHHDASDADAAALDQIMRAADRATTLTRQLLAFSRRQVLEPRIVDLRTLLHDAAEMLRRIIGNAVRLEITCDEALGPVLADPSQLEQVLVNLVVNARDAMPDGGRIRIEAGDAEVDAAWAAAHPPIPAGMFVRFAVSDEGSGIAPDVLPHIFEPFFTTKAVGKGTGLGLATVYGIVKQSGGFVFVSSQPGAGASFEVLLPRV